MGHQTKVCVCVCVCPWFAGGLSDKHWARAAGLCAFDRLETVVCLQHSGSFLSLNALAHLCLVIMTEREQRCLFRRGVSICASEF